MKLRNLTTSIAAVLAAAAGAQTASAQAPGADGPVPGADDVLAEIVVTARTRVTVATKADIAIIEAPQAISIVTSDLIERRGYDDAVDALENVAGVHFIGQFESGQILAFRGFFANGFNASRLDDSRFNFRVASFDPELIERMEFLKGPSSVLYGTSDAGGVVNVSLKAPTRDFRASVGASAGSFDRYGGSADISGPLSADGAWSGRAVVSHLESDSFIDFVDSQRTSALAALAYEPTDRTRLALNAIYQDTDDFQPPTNPLMSDGSVPDVPTSRFLGVPIHRNEYEQAVLQFNATQRLSDVARLEARASYVRAERASQSSYVYVSTGIPPSGDGYVYAFFTGDTREDYAGELRLHADLGILGLTTKNLVGVEYFTSDAVGPGNQPSQFLGTFNIFAPDYTTPSFSFPFDRSFTSSTQFAGIFGQSIVELNERLNLVLSGRYDDISLGGSSTRAGVRRENRDVDDRKFTYRVGTSYELFDGINLYGSYGTSFEPPNTRDANDNLLPPVIGEAIEVGLKASLFEGRGLLTIALYDIARENIAQRDPQDPLNFIAVGEQTHRGVEIEIQGEPARGLQFTAAYSYIDAEFTRDTRGLQGLGPYGIPENTFNLWGSYTLQDGPLAGLGVSGSVNFLDEVFVTFQNDFTLPSYERVDLGLFYRPNDRPFSIALNVENLLDERYAANARGFLGYAFGFGAPRSTVLRLRYDFY